MTTYLGKNSTVTDGPKVDRSFLGLLRQNADSFISGITMTVEITVLSIIFATIIGVFLGILGVFPNKALQAIATTYAFVFKSIPVMVLAFFVYIGIPNLTGEKIPLFIAGVVTITLENSAYTASFVRGGIDAVPKGRWKRHEPAGFRTLEPCGKLCYHKPFASWCHPLSTSSSLPSRERRSCQPSGLPS